MKETFKDFIKKILKLKLIYIYLIGVLVIFAFSFTMFTAFQSMGISDMDLKQRIVCSVFFGFLFSIFTTFGIHSGRIRDEYDKEIDAIKSEMLQANTPIKLQELRKKTSKCMNGCPYSFDEVGNEILTTIDARLKYEFKI